MGITGSETRATKKAIVIEVSRLALGLIAAGLAAALVIVWDTPGDFVKRDAALTITKERLDSELAIIKEKQATTAEATKEIPVLQRDMGIVKYRLDELKQGQTETISRLDRILQNQRTVGGTQ